MDAPRKKKIMEAEFVDVKNYPELTGHSTKGVIFKSDTYHVWVHIDEPGKKGPMHKHGADELFYCVQGECTFHFPDGEREKLKPGMVVTIPEGQFYQLENTGAERMILLGSRGEPSGKVRRAANEAVITNVQGEYVVGVEGD
jgi:mannose-6-phosphate isomerase-like protein (cupin superfamily)